MFDRQQIERTGLEEALQQMPAAVVIVEAPSGKIIFCNSQAQEIIEENLGRSAPSELEDFRDLRDSGSFEIFHPGGRPFETEEWPLSRSIRTGEEVRDEEYFYALADGIQGWVRCYCSPIYDDDEGRIVAGVGVYHDITERKRAEEELRESEERFRATFEQAAVGMSHTAPDGKLLRVNRRLCDILGYTREELVGMKIQERTHPDDLDKDLERARQLLAGEIATYSIEKRLLRKDDSIVRINLTISLARDSAGEPGYFIAVCEDIDERKRAEEQRAYHAHLLGNVQEAVIATDERFDVTAWNTGAEEMYGWRAAEALGRNLWEIVSIELSEEQRAEVGRELDETGRYRTELIAHCKDGTLINTEVTIAVLRTEQGEITGYLSIDRDITERKRSEETRARYAAVLEATNDFVATTDADERVLSVNRAGRRMLGIGEDEDVTSTTIADYYPGWAYRIVSGEGIPAAVRDGAWSGESAFLSRDRREIPISQSIVAHKGPDGEEEYFSTVARDIAERKRFETEQQRLVEIVQSSSDFIGIADLEWRATFLNEAGQRMVGLNGMEEVRGAHVLDFFVPEDRAYVRDVLFPTIMEEGRWAEELRLRHFETGDPIPVLWDAFRIDDPQTGEPIGLATVTRDITDRKRAEERLNEVREAERSRIARDLHDEALQDLAYAMSQAQLVRAALEGPEKADRTERLAASLKRVERQLRGSIYDLRLGQDLERSLDELLEDLVRLHRDMNPECEIILSTRDEVLSGPLGKTGKELLRIVGEALTNARRHSGARSVLVSVWSSEDELRAEVSDDGRGFEPPREPSASGDVTGGTGVKGMRERAQALGATLRIESEPGRGAKVRFGLDLKKDRGEPEEEVRILLVEDHATVREAIASSFSKEEGFEIVGQAGSLAEARRVLGTEPEVDVAVVDLGLPDGYGGDLIEDLREANPQAQALVLSASLDWAETARAVEAGAAGVLHKTAGLDEVVEAVRRLRAGETLLPLEEVVELLRFAGSERRQEYEARQAIERLTPREREVLQALAEGLDSEGIAERLHISLRTQRNHMANILAKLEVHSQLQALVFAVRHGVVEIS